MKILLVGPICSTGYGVAATNLAIQLVHAGNQVCIVPIGPVDTSWLEPKTQLPPMYAGGALPDVDVVLGVWHEWDHPAPPVRNVPNILRRYVAMPTFELDQVREDAVAGLSKCWRTLVSSPWCKSVLLNQGVPNVHFTPFLGVDTKVFSPSPMEQGKVFRMLNIGKLELRKGHDLCIQIADRLIQDGFQDFEFWTMWSNPFLQDYQDSLRKLILDNAKNPAKVRNRLRFVGYRNPASRVADVVRLSHVGVYPYRAEGWNLPLLEALAVGRHVVASFNTGPMTFLDQDNAQLVSKHEREPAVDGIWFHGQGQWFTPDLEELLIKVKAMYVRWESGKLGLNQSGIETAEKFTWKRAAERLTAWLAQEWR